MVGALADWFAVTALFRHPLGLPIPHTAIIPTRKDQLGEACATSSAPTSCPSRSSATGCGRPRSPGASAAGWPSRSTPRRVTDEAATLLRGAIGVLRDEDVRAVLEQALLRRLVATPVGPPLGRLLDPGGRGPRARRAWCDWSLDQVAAWLPQNETVVVDALPGRRRCGRPRFVDGAVAARVYRELVRVAREVQADPDHPLRRSVDRLLARSADDLRHDPARSTAPAS